MMASLKGRLHLQVEFKGQKEMYQEQLSLLLEDSELSQEAIGRLCLPEATDGINLAGAVRTGSGEVQARFGLTPEMADQLVRWLTADESRLFELETFIPQDTFRVELRGDDSQHQRISRAMAKQGATAVLFLLFGAENRILMIDQPDDYLDDGYAHEEVLKILREQKKVNGHSPRGQVILATHDATIPVMSNADLVIFLESRDDQTCVAGQASIDHPSMREAIKAGLQGGEEAFRQRAIKYPDWPCP